MGVKKSSMIHLSSSNWFGPLFFSQNWTNFENIPKISNFLMDFDNFCSFFEYHSILAEKQRTKQVKYSFLSFSASLDTQDTLQGGIIAEWKKFWQEIPVWFSDDDWRTKISATIEIHVHSLYSKKSTFYYSNLRLCGLCKQLHKGGFNWCWFWDS